jgi:hypothetical protein
MGPAASFARRPRSGLERVALAGLSAVIALAWSSAVPLRAQSSPPSPQRYPVRCRLAAGPWTPCVMTIEQLGERWWLELGGHRVDFRHDGRGSVQMQRPPGQWQNVTSRWSDEQALCWDGVCAKGEFPLD